MFNEVWVTLQCMETCAWHAISRQTIFFNGSIALHMNGVRRIKFECSFYYYCIAR